MRLLRYSLFAMTAMACLGFAPASSVRADTTIYGSAGIVTAAILERSYVEMTPRGAPSMGGRSAADLDRSTAGVAANPAPLPGLLLFAATGLAYLWHWRSKRRERSPGTAA
jgi:hypothetical protein